MNSNATHLALEQPATNSGYAKWRTKSFLKMEFGRAPLRIAAFQDQKQVFSQIYFKPQTYSAQHTVYLSSPLQRSWTQFYF